MGVLKGGMNNQEAMERLKGTLSGDKNEILFSQFQINYNDLPQVYRKGTVFYKKKVDSSVALEETNAVSISSSSTSSSTAETLVPSRENEEATALPSSANHGESTECAPLSSQHLNSSCAKSKKKQKLE